MAGLLTMVATCLSCVLLIRAWRLRGRVAFLLAGYGLATAHVVLWGVLLSALNRLAGVGGWLLLSLATAGVSFGLFLWRRQDPRPLLAGQPGALWRTLRSLNSDPLKTWYLTRTSGFHKALLTPLVGTALLLGCLHVVMVVYLAPHNFDGMTYHLARVAYFLQHGNIAHYDASYWAQTIHAKNGSLLLIYTYLVTGRSENLTQGVQLLSYAAAVVAVYGISRELGQRRREALFAAGISALLVEWLMEATTTQNDLILAAYTGIAVYFLLRYRRTAEARHLGMVALAAGLALGTKIAYVLVLPSLAVILVHALRGAPAPLPRRLRHLGCLAALGVVSLGAFALPTGLLENLQQFGHPVGPVPVRVEHSFEGRTSGYVLRHGTRNLARFGLDALSLDGLPASEVVLEIQGALKVCAAALVVAVDDDLESREASRRPFRIWKEPRAHEDLSHGGVLGFGLLGLMLLLTLVGVPRSPPGRVLAGAAVLLVLAQAYTAPYDPWRGRYFVMLGIFSAPLAGVCLRLRSGWLKGPLLALVLLGCLSAWTAVLLRQGREVLPVNARGEATVSVFAMDRLEQMTTSGTAYRAALKAFERRVPSKSTVAVALPGFHFEYPLFGPDLGRRLVPIHGFRGGRKPIPAKADFLLYTPAGFPCRARGDVHLGVDWYLRKLGPHNRRCAGK